MRADDAKRIASQGGCVLWYDRQTRLWYLHAVGALEVEASGGCFMSPGQLSVLTRAQFGARVADAVKSTKG